MTKRHNLTKKRTIKKAIEKKVMEKKAIEKAVDEDDLQNTHYAYDAHALFPGVENDLDEEDVDFFNTYYRAMFSWVGDDRKIDDVRAFLKDDPHRDKWVDGGLCCARSIDILLTMASDRIAEMLVREFNANPGQQDASNAQSAVQYRLGHVAFMRRLADEFEAKNRWFEKVNKM